MATIMTTTAESSRWIARMDTGSASALSILANSKAASGLGNYAAGVIQKSREYFPVDKFADIAVSSSHGNHSSSVPPVK